MTEPRRFRMIDFSLILFVLAVAAGARGWYLLECAGGGHGPGPIRVQDAPPQADPVAAARLVAAGLGGLPGMTGVVGTTPPPPESEPNAHVAPGYPSLLALAHRAPDPDRTVRWVQVALGALTAVFYFLFARRAFNNLLLAAITGLLCALHPFWVVAATELADGVLAAFGLGLALWLGCRAGQSGGALTSLLYGLTLAGLALVRAAFLPFAFVAMVCFLWRCRALPRGWLYALLAFLGFVNALAPWTVRNYRLTGEVVPVVDTTWRHLWAGNHPGATGGPDTATATAKDPLARQVMEEVRQDPAQTLNRRLWAGLSFVFGEEWLLHRNAWQAVPEAEGRGEMPPWLDGSFSALLSGTLLGMLLLGLVGWRWTYAWWRESLPAALALVWLPLPYLLSHAEALAGPRLPLDGLLLCFAAFVLVALLPRIGTHLRDGPNSAEGVSVQ
jgi:4-amino-4-deoxy-L-arabinose transferase-like glycosyltransferase